MSMRRRVLAAYGKIYRIKELKRMTMAGSFHLANWLWLTIIAHLLSDFVSDGQMVDWKR